MEHTVQNSRAFEPSFEVSPNRAYLSPPLAGGLIAPPQRIILLYPCVVIIWFLWMPLVFGNSLSVGRLKENCLNLQTTTQIKAQPQGVVADGKYEFSEKASEHLE